MLTVDEKNRTTDGAECWCLSTGTAGMLSQVTGLASAVGIAHDCKTTRLAFPWKWMPLDWIPRSNRVVVRPETLRVEQPPRLVISCGRHGVVPALTLKRKYGDQVCAVHIQDPKCGPAPFDMVIVPKHDHLRGPNVFATMGAIHYVTPERLAEARSDPLAEMLAADGRPVVAVLVGGPNGYYGFSDPEIAQFVEKLHTLGARHQVRLAVLPSNRTPPNIVQRLAREFAGDHFVWTRTGPNPYFAALAVASHVVVTGDSVSMVTEATATGLPVFVEHPSGRHQSGRMHRFHEMFQHDGLVRPFDGSLAEWTYQPPHDTPRVAQIIRERIGLQGRSAPSDRSGRITGAASGAESPKMTREQM